MSESRPRFEALVDLACDRNGGRVLSASDDFFAAKENLIRFSEPEAVADRFTARGKWMDGWETRRRRSPGNDWCTVKLGFSGIIRAVRVDTSHFIGNQPEQASIDAANIPEDKEPSERDWTPILDPAPIAPDAPNSFAVGSDEVWTHLRLNIFPDGGVARLRVFGEVAPDWNALTDMQEVELSSLKYGGRVIDCSNEHFGQMLNLIHPSKPLNAGDGWETARRRRPGHDWVIVQLGRPGVLSIAEIDTSHFIGNYPGSCSLEGAFLLSPDELAGANWRELTPKTKLRGDSSHHLELAVGIGPVSHVRLNIFPDGGVARLRVLGRPVPDREL